MTPNKIAAGVVAAGVIAAGGGSLALDASINPYVTDGTILEKVDPSILPQAGADTVLIDTTQPKITLEKWSGQAAMGVTYQGFQATGARTFLATDVQWSDANQTMQVIPLDASSTMEDGGYEINIILNSPPTSNVFNFSIDGADNLDFFFQGPLWKDEGLKAPTKDCTDTDCISPIEGHLIRPHNVVGSFAVYYKNHTNHQEGRTNFATGKAYHIFRPKVTDANGNTVWADMSYANSILTVTVPQTFLDTAIYPVTIDPTMGYTTVGASESSLQLNTRLNSGDLASPHTAAPGERITQMTIYARCSAGGDAQNGHMDLAPYTVTGTLFGTRLGNYSTTTNTVKVTKGTGGGWTSVSVNLLMATNIAYGIAEGNFDPSGCTTPTSGLSVFFDTAAANSRDLQTAGGVLPASWVHNVGLNSLVTEYFTYISLQASPMMGEF